MLFLGRTVPGPLLSTKLTWKSFVDFIPSCILFGFFSRTLTFIQSTLSDPLCENKQSLLNNFSEIHSNLIMELLEWEGASGHPPVLDSAQNRVSYSRLLRHVHTHALCSSKDGLHSLSGQPVPLFVQNLPSYQWVGVQRVGDNWHLHFRII